MGWWLNVKAGSEVTEKGHVPFPVCQAECFVVVFLAAQMAEIQAPVQTKYDIFLKKYGSYYNNNENTDMGDFKDNFKQETGAEEMFFHI